MLSEIRDTVFHISMLSGRGSAAAESPAWRAGPTVVLLLWLRHHLILRLAVAGTSQIQRDRMAVRNLSF
ncbi:MAG: hypothetical protein JWM11_7432 [Planctomycetaceae bacterium]|nr:hypothetical protein [Planctomycetaceae bacterium]